MNGANNFSSFLIQRLRGLDGNHYCTDPLVGKIPQEFASIFRPDYMEGDSFLYGVAGKILDHILMNKERLTFDAYEVSVNPPFISKGKKPIKASFYVVHPRECKIPVHEIIEHQAQTESSSSDGAAQLKKAVFNRNCENIPIGWLIFPQNRIDGSEIIDGALVFVDREIYMKTKEMLSAPTVAPVKPSPGGNTRLPSDAPFPG